MTQAQPHNWRFFYAGGFHQLSIETADDLRALKWLDQKLWATLACPTAGLALDARMLAYLDEHKLGRIRAPQILATIDWLDERLDNLDILFTDAPLTSASFRSNQAGQALAHAAEHLLHVRQKPADAGLSWADSDDLVSLFPAHQANGDGLIPVAFAQDDRLKRLIAEIVACLGGEQDRSGEVAIGVSQIQTFYQQVAAAEGWQHSLDPVFAERFGPDLHGAMAVLEALRDKIDDYFTRLALVRYDERARLLMSVQESELLRLSALNLAQLDELKALPLARLEEEGLPLQAGVNPAWQQALQDLHERVLKPVFGELERLSESQWRALLAQTAGYFAWRQARPELAVLTCLPLERIAEIRQDNAQQALLDLVEADKQVEQAAANLLDLDKLLRLQRGFITLLRNFVSLQTFYEGKELAVFQAGKLFIDGKSCDLVVEVADIHAHAAIATASNSFLLYLTCTRKGRPIAGREALNLVAVVSAGVDFELMPGRNGLFYDRDGHEWDATVVKVVENAISVRQAFFSPYQRLAELISTQIQKFAQNQDSKVLMTATKQVSGETPLPANGFDIARFAGIFAAIGLALGAVGTALAAVFTGLLALSWWQWPIVIITVLGLISGPSMLLAWFKLRRRSLGPILDANGWAINSQAKISLGFGGALTQLAVLPKGASRSLKVRSDQPVRRWPYWLALVLATLLLIYYFSPSFL